MTFRDTYLLGFHDLFIVVVLFVLVLVRRLTVVAFLRSTGLGEKLSSAIKESCMWEVGQTIFGAF